MNFQRKNKLAFRLIGLRGKLLLATLVLFILPIAGLSYLKELELFLKHNHSQSVIVIAKTIASVFRDNSSLITLNQLTQSAKPALYCYSLKNKKIIDGYSDDWFELQNSAHNSLQSTWQKDVSNKQPAILCANDDHFYYFLVTMDKPLFENNKNLGQIKLADKQTFDSITFQYLDYAHKVQNFTFKLKSPGWVNGQLSRPLSGNSRQQVAAAIPAQWQGNSRGFNLEFKLPIAQINHYLGFKLQRSNDADDVPATVPGSSSIDHLIPVVLTDPLSIIKLEQLVPQNTHLWLLNKHQYVSAKTDPTFNAVQNSKNDFSILAFYRRLYLIISNHPEQQSFYDSEQARINSDAIQLTLKGQSTAEWLDNPHSDKMILSVSTPVYDNENNVIGTLVLEQNNDTLLTLQDKTFEGILFLTLIIFFSVAIILLFMSTRLLKRIINLRDDTNLALSNDGIISNQLYRNDNDEIGDLARSFSTLLSRIDQNNQYLRSLSGKLSHELRTPLTIIKSSLENMDNPSLSAENKKYTLRANEGCIRLTNLLNRMSEASRLEQSIDAIDKENIEIVNFLTHYVDSQRVANNDIEIVLHTSINELAMNISPELIAQLLDKLFSNAISFHQNNTPVSLKISREKNTLLIELTNYGTMIDNNKLKSIFTSLTSYRTKNTSDVHLGLGLYISRLICEFHQGQLSAINNEQQRSVSFIISLPIDE